MARPEHPIPEEVLLPRINDRIGFATMTTLAIQDIIQGRVTNAKGLSEVIDELSKILSARVFDVDIALVAQKVDQTLQDGVLKKRAYYKTLLEDYSVYAGYQGLWEMFGSALQTKFSSDNPGDLSRLLGTERELAELSTQFADRFPEMNKIGFHSEFVRLMKINEVRDLLNFGSLGEAVRHVRNIRISQINKIRGNRQIDERHNMDGINPELYESGLYEALADANRMVCEAKSL